MLKTRFARLALTFAALIAALVLSPVSAMAAYYDLDALQHKAEATGWRTARAMDGSLLLFPGKPRAPMTVSASTQTMNPPAPPLADLEKRLVATGWIVRRDSDNSLLLYPRKPHAARDMNNVPQRAKGPCSGKRKTAEKTMLRQSPDLIVEALRSRGWAHVERDSDGSLLLYPRAATAASVAAEAETGIAFESGKEKGLRTLDRLARFLGDRGWRTARDTDGSLLLFFRRA